MGCEMENPIWRLVWIIALLVGILAGAVTILANWGRIPSSAMSYMLALVSVCVFLAIVGLVLEWKPWRRWRAFRQRSQFLANLAPSETRVRGEITYRYSQPARDWTTAWRRIQLRSAPVRSLRSSRIRFPRDFTTYAAQLQSPTTPPMTVQVPELPRL